MFTNTALNNGTNERLKWTPPRSSHPLHQMRGLQWQIEPLTVLRGERREAGGERHNERGGRLDTLYGYRVVYGWVELSGARLNGFKKWMQERWRERSERAPNEMGLNGGTGVQCGCWVGGGAVPLCEVREERER